MIISEEPKIIFMAKQPPKELYNRLRSKFGKMADFEKGLVVANGNFIYAKRNIPTEILAHEMIHCRRQLKIGVSKWWEKYFNDSLFRLEEEKIAFKAEMEFYKKATKEVREDYAKMRASALSSELYGNLITYDDAVEYLLQ